MKVLILAEGRLKERGLRELADDYLRRIRRHVRCDEVELKDSRAWARSVPVAMRVVALEVTGHSVSSSEFADCLDRWSQRGKGDVAFLIGGAEGLPRQLSEAADERLSLSHLTLPHRLARLLLLEQIYRGLSILHGEPYAREG